MTKSNQDTNPQDIKSKNSNKSEDSNNNNFNTQEEFKNLLKYS